MCHKHIVTKSLNFLQTGQKSSILTLARAGVRTSNLIMDQPASYTALFDLKVKQTIANETIFTQSTQVFDSKLKDYFKILYSDETHMIGGFSKTQTVATIKVLDGEGCKNVTISVEVPKEAFEKFNVRLDEFFEETISLELKKEVPGCLKANFLPAIKRCLKDPPYLRSAGNQIIITWIN